MEKTFNDFLIIEAINSHSNINEGIALPAGLKKLANNFSNSIKTKKSDVASDIEDKYGDMSFTDILKDTKEQLKNSGVGEFAKDVSGDVKEKTNKVLNYISSKVGKYSTLGLIAVGLTDYFTDWESSKGVVSKGLDWLGVNSDKYDYNSMAWAESWLTSLEWTFGIAVIISLIIYYSTKKKK